MVQSIGLKLKAERQVWKGEKFWKILEFSCYDIDDLPTKYFETLPVCAKDKDRFVVIYQNEEVLEFSVGDLISDKSYTRMKRTIRFAGHKLHLINQDIKELRKTWVGQETFDVSVEEYNSKPKHQQKEKVEAEVLGVPPEVPF